MTINRVGVWGPGTWLLPERRGDLLALASHIEQLGMSSLWMSAGFEDGVPDVFGELLEATDRLRIGTGILSIWHCSAEQTAEAVSAFGAAYPGRFIAGLGASHAPFVTSRTYSKPYSEMVDYLDRLDGLGSPPAGRMIAALGPRMLALAGERSAGAHPYFVPAEYTRQARELVGPDALLVPEVCVTLEPDPERARARARAYMALYLALPNYTANLERLGFTPDDVADGGSDRLVDAIVAWGDAAAVAGRIREHLDAGADEVLVQVLPDDDSAMPVAELSELAAALA